MYHGYLLAFGQLWTGVMPHAWMYQTWQQIARVSALRLAVWHMFWQIGVVMLTVLCGAPWFL